MSEFVVGAVIAMAGQQCVAIASDHRYGRGGMTLATNYEKVHKVSPHLYLGMSGLPTDSERILKKMRFKKNLYELRERRQMQPSVYAKNLSNLLYESRFSPFIVEPVLAGLQFTNKACVPFVCGMDRIGSRCESDNFSVAGACRRQLFGMCEAVYKPALKPPELFEIISQAFVNAVDRDASTGWGATVYLIECDKVTMRSLKTRMD